jgi:beta-N-acetylhexosaminidase
MTSRRPSGSRRLAAAALAVLAVSAAVPAANVVAAPVRGPATAGVACTNATALASWSLPALIRESIVVPVEGSAIAGAGAVARAGYGGLLVFGDSGPSDFASVVAGLRAQVPKHAGLLVMTDDEGGEVWRLANLLAPIPWARSLSAKTPAAITKLATREGRAMAALGIDMDLAPVLDIDGRDVFPGARDADGYRSFSGDGATVIADGVAFMKGLIAGGVTPVVKHFPGLGGVSPNTDDGPASTAPWASVQKASLKPFAAAIAAGAPALMLSNATVPGLTSGPATISAPAYNYLRGPMGFTGLLVTDSLSAGALGAIGISVPRAATRAIGDGADLVLYGIPPRGSALAVATSILDSVFVAVAQHRIARATLVAAALEVLGAQGADLCAVPAG